MLIIAVTRFLACFNSGGGDENRICEIDFALTFFFILRAEEMFLNNFNLGLIFDLIDDFIFDFRPIAFNPLYFTISPSPPVDQPEKPCLRFGSMGL